ncbi:MAG: hypothetical protein AAF694_05830 [Bacteroidota bacterium]
MNFQSLQIELKKHLADNPLLVFEKLESVLLYDTQTFNEMVLLRSRFNDLQKNENRDTISKDQRNLSLNKISSSLLTLIDNIKQEEVLLNPNPKILFRETKVVRRKIANLEKENTLLQAQAELSKKNAQALENQLSSFIKSRKKIEELSNNLESIKRENQQLREQIATIDYLKSNIKNLESTIATSNKLNSLIDEKLAEKEELVSRLSSENESLLDEMKVLRKESQSLRKTYYLEEKEEPMTDKELSAWFNLLPSGWKKTILEESESKEIKDIRRVLETLEEIYLSTIIGYGVGRGEFKIQYLDPISKFKNLRKVTLSKLSLSDISALQHLKKLQILSLWNCRNIIDLSIIGKIPTLNRLELNEIGNQIEIDATPISHLSKLKWLRIEDTVLTNLRLLENVKALRTVEYGFYSNDKALDSINHLKNRLSNTIFKEI